VEYYSLNKNDPRRDAAACWQSGWREILATGSTTRYSERRKTSGELILGQDLPFGTLRPSRRRSLYTLYHLDGEPVALFEAHWADWDQRGRLVATVGGRVFEGDLAKNNKLRWRQLAAMNDELPSRMEAPRWAQRW
jgi:hypothetical protein